MNFKTLNERILSKNRTKKIISVAGAENDHIIEACFKAYNEKIADFILIGDKQKIISTLKNLNYSPDTFEIINCTDEKQKAAMACKLFSEKKADLVMKGSVSTGTLLKEVLNDSYGLKGNGFLSHMACIEFEDRLLGITDGGLNISPTLEEKVKIVQNSIDFYIKLGVDKPKVALTCALEVPNPKMPATIDAAIIAKMADRQDIKGGVVDGPFAFDNAVSKEAARIKKIESPVAGSADILVAPDIEAANISAKAIIYTSHPKNGGVIIGSTSPVILLSRADDSETKFNSIVLALNVLD